MNLNKLLLWLLTIVWFVAGAWWYSHSSCASCNAETPPIAAAATSCPSFSFNDGSFNVNNADNVRFGKSNDVPILNSSIGRSMDEVVKYLGGLVASRTLTVTGNYSSSEKTVTGFENLGLARADAIKKLLIAKGISEKNIVTKAEVNESLCYNASGDTLTGGIALNVSGAVAASVPVVVADTTKPKTLFEPRTVYFVTGKNQLNITKELDDYLVKANKYLVENKDKKLLVTGHTDNVGDATKNVKLSADRAAFVKSILGKRGIPAAQVATDGKGMAEPIADNATAEGKAKNRRVTIVLQ